MKFTRAVDDNHGKIVGLISGTPQQIKEKTKLLGLVEYGVYIRLHKNSKRKIKR